MAKRWTISIKTYGSPDKHGRISLDTLTCDARTRETRMQTYRAEPAKVLARLRRNIADQFWFDRFRLRLAQEATR